jgi:hypothetical protein
MTYTKEQFLADVAAEARALREHATKEELGKLDAALLNPRRFDRCIYGQATGTCFGARAAELIFSCCKRYFISEIDNLTIEEASYEEPVFDKYVNGEEIEGVISAYTLHIKRRDAPHYSSIEAYIMQPDAKSDNLIAYLRGERDDLVL